VNEFLVSGIVPRVLNMTSDRHFGTSEPWSPGAAAVSRAFASWRRLNSSKFQFRKTTMVDRLGKTFHLVLVLAAGLLRLLASIADGLRRLADSARSTEAGPRDGAEVGSFRPALGNVLSWFSTWDGDARFDDLPDRTGKLRPLRVRVPVCASSSRRLRRRRAPSRPRRLY
jgi:hypothetical protein